jgi:hypothetical protein
MIMMIYADMGGEYPDRSGNNSRHSNICRTGSGGTMSESHEANQCAHSIPAMGEIKAEPLGMASEIAGMDISQLLQ